MKTMTKQQAVENVTNSISSIFSKEDVINLINSIKDEGTNPTKIIVDLKEKVLNTINSLSSDDIVDIHSVELELDYTRTINVSSVEITTDNLYSDLECLFEDALSDIDEPEQVELPKAEPEF